MAKITKSKKETEDYIDDMYSDDIIEKEDNTLDTSEINDTVENTEAGFTNIAPVITPETPAQPIKYRQVADGGNSFRLNIPADDTYITLGERELGKAPHPVFESANSTRKRLIEKTKLQQKRIQNNPSENFYEDDVQIPRRNSMKVDKYKETDPNNFKKVANENPYFKDNNLKVVDSRTDALFKYGLLALFAVLIVVIGMGAIKYSNYQEVYLNGTSAYINASVNFNASVKSDNTVYNNFTQPIYVNINATIQLPNSVLNELARIGNLTNITNST